MDTFQIVLYTVIAVMVIFYVRRLLKLRSLKAYSPAEVAELLKNDSIILLDVRTTGERNSKSIQGSLHIPLHELRQRSNELEQFKTKEIVSYCAIGGRSLSATAILRKLGFKSANMKGGISAWKSSGLK